MRPATIRVLSDAYSNNEMFVFEKFPIFVYRFKTLTILCRK